MASQMRSKQPRPLSIIDESSFDYTDNCSQNETANDTKESNSLEKQTQRRPARRISVAPIEHPVTALSEEYNLRDNSANSVTESTSEKSIPCKKNETKTDVADHHSHSDDSENGVQTGEAIEREQFSKSCILSKHLKDSGVVLPPTRLADQCSGYMNVNINNDNGDKHSTFTDQQTNSELGTRMYKNILNDLRTSKDTSNYSNSFERRSNEQKKLWLQNNLEGNKKEEAKDSEVNNVSKEVENTNNSNVERRKLDNKEILSTEQQAWRNKVRKSSSFTFSSVKARPLRRSMGSYDFKNSSFLGRNGRSFKKGDNMNTENYSNESVKFYLSSDVCEDKNDVINIDHGSGNKNEEQKHPKEFSLCGSHSWNGLCSIPRDGSLEQSSNVKTQSSFVESTRLHSLPNMSKIPTNQQTQMTNSKSGELSSDSHHYKTSKRSCIDSQSNSMVVRRISAVDQSDLRSLQALATRLNLPTRRLSTTIWREKYMGSNNTLNNTTVHKDSGIQSDSDDNDKPPGCDFVDDSDNDGSNQRLHTRLALVREDLVKMRLQDQALASQFLKLRHQMLELRLSVECRNNMELLDGAQEDVEVERELSRMVDIPSELLSPHYSLLHVGLTKMNFMSRRFSTC